MAGLLCRYFVHLTPDASLVAAGAAIHLALVTKGEMIVFEAGVLVNDERSLAYLRFRTLRAQGGAK